MPPISQHSNNNCNFSRETTATTLAQRSIRVLLGTQGINNMPSYPKLEGMSRLDAETMQAIRAVDRQLRQATDHTLSRIYDINPRDAFTQLNADVQALKHHKSTLAQDNTLALNNVMESACEQSPWVPRPFLEQAIAQWSTQKRMDYVAKQNASPLLLDILANQNNSASRIAIAEHNNTAPHTLAALSKCRHAATLCAIAKHPNTPTHVLEKLATNHLFTVRAYIAKNLCTPPHVLEKLSRDLSPTVLVYVAANPKTPTSALDKLATQSNLIVHGALLFNPSTSAQTIEQIFKQKQEWSITHWSSLPSDLNWPGNGHYAFSMAISDKLSSAALNTMARSTNLQMPIYVACNPKAQAQTLETILNTALSQGGTESGIAALLIVVIFHKNTTTNILDRIAAMAEQFTDPALKIVLKSAVALHSQTSPDCLQRLANTQDKRLLLAIRQNANTPERCLQNMPPLMILLDNVLQYDTDLPSVLQYFARTGNTLPADYNVLSALAQPHRNTLRLNLATNHITPDDTLRWLINAPDIDNGSIKAAIAARKHLSEDIRNMLTTVVEQVRVENAQMDAPTTKLATALAARSDMPFSTLVSWIGYADALDATLAQNRSLQKVAARERDLAPKNKVAERPNKRRRMM